ncbi:MAG: hypothetical protein R8K48_02455 [Gallionella sp.]
MEMQPTKLLMALLLGMGSLAFVATPALADSSSNPKNSKDSSSHSPTCSGQLITACGQRVMATTCPGSSVSSETKSGEAEDTDHKSKDKDKDKDSKGKDDHDRNEMSHRDHLDRTQGTYEEGDGKVTICHRMGGAEVTLTVANDGWFSGHSQHALDTVGSCADFDAEENDANQKYSDTSISVSDAGYAAKLTPAIIACLKGSPSETFTIRKPNDSTGTAVQSPGGGFNNSQVSLSIVIPGQSPSRGGARTLR